MGTRLNRWRLTGLFLFILAVCILVAAGSYLLLQRWGRATLRPRYAATSVDVVAAYPGASAEEVERQVIIPLEVTFAGTARLKSVRSKAQFGLAHLRLEFEDGVDHSQARQEVINRLSVIDQLPPGVSPMLSPASAGNEILRYVLRGPRDARGKDVYTSADLRALQDWVLQREFRRIPRVLDAMSAGGALPRYEIHLDPDRLRRYGLSVRQVQTAIAESNGNIGGDIGRQGDVPLTVRGIGLFGGGKDPMPDMLDLKDPREAATRLRAEEQHRLREIRSLVITTANGVPVRLEDVVEGGRLAPEEEIGRKGVIVGRQPGPGQAALARPGEPDDDDVVLGIVYLRPGEDRKAALKAVKEKIREIHDASGRLLPGVRVDPLWYRGNGVEQNLFSLQAGFATNVSPQAAAEKMRTARAILLQHPEVRVVLSEISPDETGLDAPGTEGARILALLHSEKDERRNRREFVDEVQSELARALDGIDWDFLPDGIDDFQAAFEAAPGAGLLKIIGPDLNELERLAGKAETQLRKLDGISGVHVRRIGGKPHLEFVVDSEKCARWGVSVADVNNVIALAAGGQRVTQMIEGEKTFDITLLWPASQRRDAQSILDIAVDVMNQRAVPDEERGGAPAPPTAAPPPRLRLRDLVSPRGADGHADPQGVFVRPGIATIWREQGRRLITVRFPLRNGKERDILAEAERALAPLFSAPYRAEWSVGVDRAD